MRGKRDKNNEEIRANVRVCDYNPSHSVVQIFNYLSEVFVSDKIHVHMFETAHR